eukprot:COSAG01_NODE_1053_length_11913_cov_4.198307_9_plen_120_part_00
MRAEQNAGEAGGVCMSSPQEEEQRWREKQQTRPEAVDVQDCRYHHQHGAASAALVRQVVMKHVRPQSAQTHAVAGSKWMCSDRREHMYTAPHIQQHVPAWLPKVDDVGVVRSQPDQQPA